MEQQNYSNVYVDERRETAVATLMRNVYLWMTFALAATGLTAAFVAGNPGWVQTIAETKGVFMLLLLAEVGLVIFLSARLSKMSFPTASLLFVLYSVLNGVTLSFIFLAYTLSSIATTFFITAGTFGAMALVGSFTKKDLSAYGRFLLMALIGLIIASVVNIFIGSSAVEWGISFAGVLIFTGLTAYDAQKIKRMLQAAGSEVNEDTMKLSLMGSLTLYLDFINLFLYLLRFFGNSRN